MKQPKNHASLEGGEINERTVIVLVLNFEDIQADNLEQCWAAAQKISGGAASAVFRRKQNLKKYI